MIDLPRDLKQRVDAVLANLATLSDAPTQQLNDAAPAKRARARLEPGETWRDHETAHHPSFESREPPGVRDSRSNAPHPEHDPLFDWFVHRLGLCHSLEQVRGLCAEAEIRHSKRVNRQEARPHALAGNPETTKQRDKRIGLGYPGLSPDEVAAIESERAGYCSPASVRITRLQKERDPETGHELPGEVFLKGPHRKARARELDQAEVPVREIARRFRVSHSTVLGWLGRRGRDEEAA